MAGRDHAVAVQHAMCRRVPGRSGRRAAHRARDSGRGSSAISARVPPSPRLSARMTNDQVLDGNDDDQRPEDQGEHATDVRRVGCTPCAAQSIHRARRGGWCRCPRTRRRAPRGPARDAPWRNGRFRRVTSRLRFYPGAAVRADFGTREAGSHPVDRAVFHRRRVVARRPRTPSRRLRLQAGCHGVAGLERQYDERACAGTIAKGDLCRRFDSQPRSRSCCWRARCRSPRRRPPRPSWSTPAR